MYSGAQELKQMEQKKSFMIGKTLGHYQTTNQLGKLGMGEVFQAKDRVLGREVAIKILPEEFARDTDRIAISDALH